jgi:hypothetical protein
MQKRQLLLDRTNPILADSDEYLKYSFYRRLMFKGRFLKSGQRIVRETLIKAAGDA